MTMTTKQIEAIKMRRDLMLELTDFVLSPSNADVFTEEQKQEMREYRIYLKDISDFGYQWKQAPLFFKTSRVYNVVVEMQDALDKLRARGLI